MATDNFRPKSFAQFPGQTRVCENLRVFVQAAKKRNEAVDHLLFCGPAGLGKTTLAGVVAAEMGSKIISINAPSIKNKTELLNAIKSVRKHDILFIDEIHRLKIELQEILYIAMEDFKVETIVRGDVVTTTIPRFTLVGATTHQGLLSKPLRERFGEVCTLEPYSTAELSEIVFRAAEAFDLCIHRQSTVEIAKRAKKTPRIALKLLRRIRDFAQSRDIEYISPDFVLQCMDKMGIDSSGLDELSRRYLALLVEKNRPIGLDFIASSLGEIPETVEDSVEPYLLSINFVERMPNGRIVTDSGRDFVRNQSPPSK